MTPQLQLDPVWTALRWVAIAAAALIMICTAIGLMRALRNGESPVKPLGWGAGALGTTAMMMVVTGVTRPWSGRFNEALARTENQTLFSLLLLVVLNVCAAGFLISVGRAADRRSSDRRER